MGCIALMRSRSKCLRGKSVGGSRLLGGGGGAERQGGKSY